MPWKKGESGNPNGRPPVKDSLSDLLREKIEEIDSDQERPNKDIIAEALVSLAKQGNLAAIERIFDRLEGKPKQQIDQYIFQDENPVLDILRGIMDDEETT